MTNTYLVTNDGYGFQWLALQVDDFINLMPENYSDTEIFHFSYHNINLAPWWKNIESHFTQSKDSSPLAIPDVSLWLSGAALVLSGKAYEVLHEVLNGFGEFLPVNCLGEIYYIFNCLTLGEIDKEQSHHIVEDGFVVGVKSLKFDNSDVKDKVLFKTTFNRCKDVYCNNTFKNIVESYCLTGIAFKADLLFVIEE
ncbi:MAG: DUF1629 domain-containing protein [Pseudomonadota bacterium]